MVVLFLVPLALARRQSDSEAAASDLGPAVGKRTYLATRLAHPAPKIDGKLDEACWTQQGEWAGQYAQFIPNHSAPPSEETRLKILYDEKYLYVAIRADDRQPRTIYAGARDQFTGDVIGLTFDSYFDRRTAFEFNLTAAGQKLDITVNDKSWDTTWNAVWDGKVHHDAAGWNAEMRIPLNQLRYNNRHPQVWGLHAWRWLARNGEESQWKLLPNDGTGAAYSFGELHGLVLPPPRRHLEVVPYVSGKYILRPEADGRDEGEVAGGLDAKYQLGSSFTLDATVNPDFGQVEADPSQMNLTAFETFLEERRPFFLEGKNILQFRFGSDLDPLFYSRRIGHRPSLDARDDAHEVPENTSILAAWKVTGRTVQGLSLGLLHAATAEEHALYTDETGTHRQSIEPASQYVLARGQQEFAGGDTTVGGIAVATVRTLKTDELRDLLPEQAFVGGIDWNHYWNDRTYYFKGQTIASHVAGSAEAIDEVQRSSARYFQRPDADYLDYDPTRTELAGWGAMLEAGKASKGNWRWSEKLTLQSPGLNFNDLGYHRRVDRIEWENEVGYVVKEPRAFYRSFEARLENENNWNFDGRHTRSDISAEVEMELRNKSYASADIGYYTAGWDMSALRGGPMLRASPFVETSGYGRTDAERKWVASGWWYASRGASGGYRSLSYSGTVTYRPVPPLKLSLSAQSGDVFSRRQYVEATSLTATPEYVVSELHNKSMSYTLRAQWFVRPELSVQYYGSPFASAGEYRRFERIVAPTARDYAARGAAMPAPRRSGDMYYFDHDADGDDDVSVERPDFAFGEFRSNLVLRWEFQPGSNLYLVWSQGRSDEGEDFDKPVNILRGLTRAPATNVFLVKCSYWFSI